MIRFCQSYKVDGGAPLEAGEAAARMKRGLTRMGLPRELVRRASICMYEGEINMVIHAGGGSAQVRVDDKSICITLMDNGPGMLDVYESMKEGVTTADEAARALGFGAGMGLPNMRKYSDRMTIDTGPGIGTTVTMWINL